MVFFRALAFLIVAARACESTNVLSANSFKKTVVRSGFVAFVLSTLAPQLVHLAPSLR